MASTARLDELKKKFDENPRRYFAPLANEHRKSGDLDQAIALCRTHLPQQPAHISGHIVLAQALFEAGSLDEARDIFHSALGLDPENLIALRYLGDIARDADDVETARGWYQRVLEVDPRNDEIVQIVRELDAPPRAQTEEVGPVAVAAAADVASEQTATAAPPAAVKPPVDNDARFAPLSLESLDLDEHAEPAADHGSPQAAAEQAGDAPDIDATFDVHAAWDSDTPTVELAVPAAPEIDPREIDPREIDPPEIDPFDLDPSASAAALFDGSTAPSADDFFLTELANPEPMEDTAQVEAPTAAADSWSPASETEESAPTASADPEVAAFEEGSFYLEAVAPAPVESAPIEVASMESAVESSATDSPIDAAAYELPGAFTLGAEPESEAAASDVAREPIEEDPITADPVDAVMQADASAPAADADWQTPHEPAVAEFATSEGHGELGLEVMEFVPPSSEAASHVSGFSTDADPLVGRTPELMPASHGATPPAFVTETMAELYLQQGFRNEALAVYRELLTRNPSDASLRERVEQIENGSMSSLGMATLSETVVESALKRQSARPAKSVRTFFASLAGRRAPAPPLRADDAGAAPNDTMMYAGSEPAVHSEPAAAQSVVAESSAALAAPSDTDRIAPMMSAAETLAMFDPFADTDGMSVPGAEPIAEDAFESDSAGLPPNVELVAASDDASDATDSAATGGSLDDLFPDAPVTPRTEAVAQTLATAFGRTEPQGRPTRAANSELSLDKVFRGSSESTPASDGGFSFDQFFSDARQTSGGDVAAPAMSPPETGRNAGAASDAHDIEQFTAWLEGLKKK